jgi:hypothetical protein
VSDDGSAAVTPRDTLGVPALPPARATVLTNRLRARLAGLHRTIAPPPIQILEAVFGMLDHAAIVALCELGVPELLRQPTTIDTLARAAHVEPARFERLLRYCATRGWIRFDRHGRVRPTRITKFLRTDHPGGWRAWVTFAGGPDVVGALGQLGVGVREGVDPFATANGLPFFEWMSSHPDRSAAFDAAMEAGARMHGLVVAAALDWSSSRAVCDVGGGTGVFLAVLLEEEPHLRGAVLDLPDVITHARPHDRIEFVAGDAFVAIPRGFDTYLFVNVLHNWGDEDAVRLLTRACEATDASARIVVVDADRPRRPVDDVSVQTDLLMLALTPGGRERSADEFAALGSRAGLRLEHSTLLASGDRANVLVPVR